MPLLDIMAVMSFAQQFFGVLKGVIQERQKRQRFHIAVVEEVCRVFETEVEARFVLEEVLSQGEVVRLLVEPATSDRKERFLNVFEAEVNQSGIALWR